MKQQVDLYLVFEDEFGVFVSKWNQVGTQNSNDQEKGRGTQGIHQMNPPVQPCNGNEKLRTLQLVKTLLLC